MVTRNILLQKEIQQFFFGLMFAIAKTCGSSCYHTIIVVGALERCEYFFCIGNFIIPRDFQEYFFQRGGWSTWFFSWNFLNQILLGLLVTGEHQTPRFESQHSSGAASTYQPRDMRRWAGGRGEYMWIFCGLWKNRWFFSAQMPIFAS